MPDLVFEVRGLTKVYRSGEVEVRAQPGVDMALEAGELVVLLGPSGSDKSTPLNVLDGIDHATAGTLRFRDHELSSLDDAGLTANRRNHVGLSSAPVGSSQSKISGLFAIARAMAMRCCSPPEICAGK